MKNLIYVLALTIISCNNQPQKRSRSDKVGSTQTATGSDPKSQRHKETCWAGTLNGKTPIFIHYQLDSNIIVGEITYLNTKDKQPIKLLGTVEENKTTGC